MSTTTLTPTGLSSEEARERLAADGPNTLPVSRPPSPLLLLLRQLTHFFALMLWAAAGLAVFAGMPQLGVAIVVVVVVNGLFAFAQEYRADRAGQRLRELLPVRAAVRRDGRRQVVPATELVRGDVVLLDAGDRISADLHLERVDGLAVDESTLTGESAPARPEKGVTAYAGTFVAQGEATAVVIATGAGTRLAGIASMTRRTHRPPGPLAVRLGQVVRIVALVAVALGVTFFGISQLLGMHLTEGFLLAVGVTVALVPEGLLPTVTLSLARAAHTMAAQHALVRRLESVETLGSTTVICTDKTGTLTRNEMSVVRVWTPDGAATVQGSGYRPDGAVTAATAEATRAVADLAAAATRCATGRAVERDGAWTPMGDPMEVALHVLALRCGLDPDADEVARPELRRVTFDPARRRSLVVVGDRRTAFVAINGAPDAVLPLCGDDPRLLAEATAEIERMGRRGLRVLAVAAGPLAGGAAEADLPVEQLESGLRLLGLVGLQDPPREGVADAVAACRAAHIQLAMVTGDHPSTGRAIAEQVNLALPDSPVLIAAELPDDEEALGAVIDVDGLVIARAAPEDKLRIARALRRRGHVVAMTGDGVNDGPALREADIGVAMGRSGTDVAREAADLVLLDDHFATIVTAVRYGRATFANIRRFLTYHLTDNVAEVAPFLLWALSGGGVPPALGVLQVLALDIGTDLLPALALGAEPPSRGALSGPARTGRLIDRRVLGRAFGVLGPVEAAVELGAFIIVLSIGGWSWGAPASSALLAIASGTAFTAVVLGQLANAFACRSEHRPVGRWSWRGNPLLLGAVAVELVLLAGFLGLPPIPQLLGGSVPTPLGWALAALAVPAVLLADAAHKRLTRGGRESSS
ncbi:cation-translocating P-type ATPase [Pseudonocardia bannensis]|uniref:Cation-transporting P-type ATPase n=1 Tax=Pseudonocardia bannensis TaxID=630973 RepID=A0A848DES2_9PSEU|nr:cation-transporting P-type ATPase [Pseudonocardia bannensis]NMH91097.1 cation-transporting P-type ATPase [Pseudonocardia bannensis]